MILIVASCVISFCILVLTVVSISGIKFYIINSGVETAKKDSLKLKIITILVSVFAYLALGAILLF